MFLYMAVPDMLKYQTCKKFTDHIKKYKNIMDSWNLTFQK